MAVIKQISVFGENGWTDPPYDIGANASKVTLDSSINTVSTTLSQGSNIQDAITTIAGELSNISSNISTSVNSISTSVNRINDSVAELNTSVGNLNGLVGKISGLKIKEYKVYLKNITGEGVVNVTTGRSLNGSTFSTSSVARVPTTASFGHNTIPIGGSFQLPFTDFDDGYYPISVTVSVPNQFTLSGYRIKQNFDENNRPIPNSVQIPVSGRYHGSQLPSGTQGIRASVVYAKTNTTVEFIPAIDEENS